MKEKKTRALKFHEPPYSCSKKMKTERRRKERGEGRRRKILKGRLITRASIRPQTTIAYEIEENKNK